MLRRLQRVPMRLEGRLLLRRVSASLSTQPAPERLTHVCPDNAFAPATFPSAGGGGGGQPAYQNVDGLRVDDGRYTAFKSEVRAMLGEERVVDDPVRTFAFGTDASFYRLVPQAVVRVHTEQEVVEVLGAARRHATPVTFRAAGTSLSGQAITDSVLMKLSHNGKAWRRYKIADEGRSITVEPGLIGGEVNRLLASYKKKHNCSTQYKIGPDPASIESCMIGGIVANNSSGEDCASAPLRPRPPPSPRAATRRDAPRHAATPRDTPPPPQACAAASRRTRTTPSPTCASSSPTAPCSTPRAPTRAPPSRSRTPDSSRSSPSSRRACRRTSR